MPHGLAGTPASPPELTYTLLDGPRTDVGDSTQFWLDRFGAPRRVRDALGDETEVSRTNPTFPALVTRVQYANGRVLGAAYDGRGNVTAVTDSATVATGPLRYATTQYQWDPRWDFVTQVTQPEGDVTRSQYDPANGNVLWREDGRGSSTRTNFTYYSTGAAAGLLARSLTALGVKDSLSYEPALLNVVRATAPHGQFTDLLADAVGRVVRVTRPIDASGALVTDSTGYDVMDRDTLSRSSGPGELLVTRRRYDAAGNPDSLTNQSTPDPNGVGVIRRAFTHDQRHRLTAETLVGYHTILYGYDPAGNLLSGSRRPAARTYDALNRLVRKAGGDTSQYVYDEVGNLRAAFNAYARDKRLYAPNGTVVADSQWIVNRRANEQVFGDHAYGSGATYDLNLRRTTLVHPGALRPTSAPQRAAFSVSAGLLDSVVDVHGNRFAFGWDADQRLARLVRRQQAPDSLVETLAYDSLARRVRRRQLAGAVILHDDSLVYDRRDKIRKNVTTGDTLAYSPLGNLSLGVTSNGTESYTTDALGLRRLSQGWLAGTGRPTTYTYDPGSERLVRGVQPAAGGLSGPLPDTTYWLRDADGALREETRAHQFQTQPLGAFYRETRRTIHTYDSERRLIRTAFTLDTSPAPPGPPFVTRYDRSETYRYDAIGRRVWTEVLRDTAAAVCTNHDRSSGCRLEVTRTVWDGDQLLYEVRAPVDTVGEGSENDNASGVFYGRVGYTHGLGIDTPLGLFKGAAVVLPFTDWRGQYDLGTCPATLCSNSAYYFPGAGATAYGDANALPTGPPSWQGSLITQQADASGLLYRRNRYVDPGTGRFTQEDPIGLAGGLNLYGFAGGDPVSFSDPFGLCPGPLLAAICALAQRVGPLATQVGNALLRTAPTTSTVLTEAGTGLTVGGRHGGPAHRAMVARAADVISDAGGEIVAGGRRFAEQAVDVGGGRIRYPDIIAEAADGSRVFVNVGRVNKNGTPVARERRALQDLQSTGVPTLFVPYIRPQ